MSFSNPNSRQKNPARFFLSWIGDKRGNGGWKYYDKGEQEDDKKNKIVPVGKEFSFIVLDESTFSIAGYNKQKNCGIWSNAIPSFEASTRALKVAMFDKDKTVIANGLYKDIKDKCAGMGGKFEKHVYILTNFFGEGNELNCLNLSGSSLGPWMDIMKTEEGKQLTNWFTVSDIERHEAAIDFVSPIFAVSSLITDEERKVAIRIDRGLQDYLDHYLNRSDEDEVEEEVDPIGVPDVPADKVFNTSNWGKYEIPGTDLDPLGTFDLSELRIMKQDLEQMQDFGESYANICEGIKYHQKQIDDYITAPANDVEDTPEAAGAKILDKAAAKPNPFRIKKSNWKDRVIEETASADALGKRLGDMSLQDLKDGLAYCESEDGKEFAKYADDLKAGIAELSEPPKKTNLFKR